MTYILLNNFYFFKITFFTDLFVSLISIFKTFVITFIYKICKLIPFSHYYVYSGVDVQSVFLSCYFMIICKDNNELGTTQYQLTFGTN